MELFINSIGGENNFLTKKAPSPNGEGVGGEVLKSPLHLERQLSWKDCG
jgi:hypothetical protein